jgi:predicted nucleic acid-binding protein
MTLDDIVDGGEVLIDANVLLYARNHRSPSCRRLISRCEQGAVKGVLALTALAEFSHRCMVQEAQSRGLAGSNPARALSERPEIVRQLRVYAESARALLGGPLVVVEANAADFLVALELQERHGLPTNDSLMLAVGRRHGINGIATADKSFDNVPGLVVYMPDDIS